MRLRTPRQVGEVTDFVPIDSEVTARLWKGHVEDHLHDALESVQRGTVFDHLEHVATIKTTIALHYARSLEVEEVHDWSWSDGVNRVERSGGLRQAALRLESAIPSLASTTPA